MCRDGHGGGEGRSMHEPHAAGRSRGDARQGQAAPAGPCGIGEQGPAK